MLDARRASLSFLHEALELEQPQYSLDNIIDDTPPDLGTHYYIYLLAFLKKLNTYCTAASLQR